MGKKKRQQEIERDRQILADALRELTAGVSLPETLSAQALFARLQAEQTKAEEAKAAKKLLRRRASLPPAGQAAPPVREHRPLCRRVGGWVRPVAAAAAVFFVCAGTLLAYRRQGTPLSGASMQNAAPAPAAAAGIEGAAYDLAGAVSSAAAAQAAEEAPQERAQAAEDAPKEGMAKKASSPAGEEDGAVQEPVLGDALPLEEELFAEGPSEVAQPTASFGMGIAQVELRDGIAGGSSWQDGEYLYYLAAPAEGQGMGLYILQAQDMQVMASITVQDQLEAQAVVAFGDRLALISHEAEEAGILRADIYDVADRSAPTLERTIRQDGVLAASALQEDRLCLVSTCPADDSGEQAGLPFTPRVRDSLSQGDGMLTGEQLLVPAEATTPCWTVLTLLSLAGEASPASLAIFGGTDSLLLEGDRGYLAASQYGETVQSQIFSLSLEGGIPRQLASATLPGGLLLPQALTPLPDGLLAAVQQEGAQRFYRLDAALSEPTEILLPGSAGRPAGDTGEAGDAGQPLAEESASKNTAASDTASQHASSGDTAPGRQEEAALAHTETPQYSAQG